MIVADVFLWRNKKISACVLATVTTIWILFELLEYHLLTLLCYILIFSLTALFLWANISTFIYKSLPDVPDISIPEEPFLEFASALREELNNGLNLIHEIAVGKDLKRFLAVIAGLWFLAIVGSCFDFLTLFYISFILLHTLPIFYEKYESEVNSFLEKAMDEARRCYDKVNEEYLSKIPRWKED